MGNGTAGAKSPQKIGSSISVCGGGARPLRDNVGGDAADPFEAPSFRHDIDRSHKNGAAYGGHHAMIASMIKATTTPPTTDESSQVIHRFSRFTVSRS